MQSLSRWVAVLMAVALVLLGVGLSPNARAEEEFGSENPFAESEAAAEFEMAAERLRLQREAASLPPNEAVVQHLPSIMLVEEAADVHANGAAAAAQAPAMPAPAQQPTPSDAAPFMPGDELKVPAPQPVIAQVEVAAKVATVKAVAAANKAEAQAPAAMRVEQAPAPAAAEVEAAPVVAGDAMPPMAAPHEGEEVLAPARAVTPPSESAVLEADVAHILAEAMARTHRVQQQRSEQRVHSGLKTRLHAHKHALGTRHSAKAHAKAHAKHGHRHGHGHGHRHRARQHSAAKAGDAHDDLVRAARERAMALMNAAHGADAAAADMSAAYSGPMAPPAPEADVQARAEAARARRKAYGEQSRQRADDIHRFMAAHHVHTHDLSTRKRLMGRQDTDEADSEDMSAEDLAAVDAELDQADQSLDESEGGLDEALLSAEHINEDAADAGADADADADAEAEGESDSAEATDADKTASDEGSSTEHNPDTATEEQPYPPPPPTAPPAKSADSAAASASAAGEGEGESAADGFLQTRSGVRSTSRASGGPAPGYGPPANFPADTHGSPPVMSSTVDLPLNRPPTPNYFYPPMAPPPPAAIQVPRLPSMAPNPAPFAPQYPNADHYQSHQMNPYGVFPLVAPPREREPMTSLYAPYTSVPNFEPAQPRSELSIPMPPPEGGAPSLVEWEAHIQRNRRGGAVLQPEAHPQQF